MRYGWYEHHLFWREFRRTFHTTGALAPSSRSLSRALARFVEGPHRPRQILEAGPGTGAVTRVILPRLGPQDHLDLVEINPRFADNLRERFARDPAWKHDAGRVEVHCGPLEDHPGEGRYDLIVSGLPLSNFAVDYVEQILAAYTRLLRPGGTLSFFEYIFIRRMKGLVAGREELTRLAGIDRVLGNWLGAHRIRREAIWFNVPPAWVHHVQPHAWPRHGKEAPPAFVEPASAAPRVSS